MIALLVLVLGFLIVALLEKNKWSPPPPPS